MTRFLSPRSLAGLVAAALVALGAQAQTAGGAATGPTGTVGSTGSTGITGTANPGASAAAQPRLLRSDEGFLKQAAQNGHAEIEASKLALGKAADPRVKEFAQKMIDDHGKTHAELKALAARKGVELPADPSLAQRAKLKLLQAADGARFDRRYADEMGVDAHESTLRMFRKAAADARDPEIKAWAAQTVPALEKHLQAARTLKGATEAQKAAAQKGGADTRAQ